MIPKDVYLQMTDFADDYTVLNMLSVNPAMALNFEEIMKKRYPHIIKFKKPDDSWRFFYLKTIRYLGKLAEKYGFIYPKHVDDYYPKLAEYFDPEKYYKYLLNHSGENDLAEHLMNNWYNFNRKLVYKFKEEHPEIRFSVLKNVGFGPFLLFEVTRMNEPYPEELNGMPIFFKQL